MTRWLPVCWAGVLSALLLGPALGPGYVLLRDMVWVPDLAVRADVLGLGSGLPRAVPSDAVVAVLDELVPGMLLQKLVLLGGLALAGTGAAALAGAAGAGLVGRLTAVSATVWSPFVAERLGMGHWPVLLGYAAVPWLAVAGRRVAAGGRLPVWAPLVLAAGCLSANAGLVSGAVLLVTALAGRPRRSRAALVAVLVLAANAPWLVAGLTHAGLAADAGGYRAFATAGDGLPAPLAVLTLGGIWNSDVVPGSREGGAAWLALAVTLLLAVAGARRWRDGLGRTQASATAALAAAGLGLALLSWAAPDALAALGAHVPGLGVLRDGSRSLALALPLTVGLLAAGAEVLVARVPQVVGRRSLAVALVLVPLAVLPDAAWGLSGLDAGLGTARYPTQWREVARLVPAGEGDAVVLPLTAYRAPGWNGVRPVLDPLPRLLRPTTVTGDDLVVDGRPVAGEDPRARQAARALAAPTPAARAAALRRMGVGWVVIERDAGESPAVAGSAVQRGALLQVTRLGRASTSRPGRADEVAMGVAWAAFLGVLGWGLAGAAGYVGVRIATKRLPAGRLRNR